MKLERPVLVAAGLSLLLALGFVLIISGGLRPLRVRLGGSTTWYTCHKCGSVKSVTHGPTNSTQILYKSPAYATCEHDWESGVSSGVPHTVPDGVVALVRQGGKYGALILRNQSVTPERADYDWWYRSDGSGAFEAGNPSVTSGKGHTPGIAFAGFRVSWSGRTDGEGWLYYDHFAGDKVLPTDLHICVTDLHSVDGLDAADPRWVYKGSPVD